MEENQVGINSSVLDKYKNVMDGLKSKFTYNRDVFFKWTTFLLHLFHTGMDPLDKLNFLVELRFIVTTGLKCNVKGCQGGIFKLRKKTGKADGYVWKCQGKKLKKGSCFKTESCPGVLSIRKNTWFSKSKLSMGEILYFTYYWWHGVAPTFVAHELGYASHTLVNWGSFCREVAIDQVMTNSEMIGGKDVVVEIDESLFGRRKYHKGRIVHGQWVFGGIERGSGKCFLIPVLDRTEATLLAAIKKWIRKDSIIVSDCWKAYSNLKDHGYTHYTVNHSENFVDPTTGYHTNMIEGTWAHAKRMLPHHNRARHHFVGYLALFMLRKKWANKDGFQCFMQAAAQLYKGGEGVLDPDVCAAIDNQTFELDEQFDDVPALDNETEESDHDFEEDPPLNNQCSIEATQADVLTERINTIETAQNIAESNVQITVQNPQAETGEFLPRHRNSNGATNHNDITVGIDISIERGGSNSCTNEHSAATNTQIESDTNVSSLPHRTTKETSPTTFETAKEHIIIEGAQVIAPLMCLGNRRLNHNVSSQRRRENEVADPPITEQSARAKRIRLRKKY